MTELEEKALAIATDVQGSPWRPVTRDTHFNCSKRVILLSTRTGVAREQYVDEYSNLWVWDYWMPVSELKELEQKHN